MEACPGNGVAFDFRKYHSNPKVPESIQRLIDCVVNTFPTSFTEGERDFSKINITMTSQRN